MTHLRPSLVALGILACAGVVRAHKQYEKPVPKPLTVEQAADAVLDAVRANDEATLRVLSEKDEPDPWLVADEHCHRGEHDASEAFARAAPRVDVERLPEHLAAWRQRRSCRPAITV